MDRNVIIAKRLVKLAKSLVADSLNPSFEGNFSKVVKQIENFNHKLTMVLLKKPSDPNGIIYDVNTYYDKDNKTSFPGHFQYKVVIAPYSSANQKFMKDGKPVTVPTLSFSGMITENENQEIYMMAWAYVDNKCVYQTGLEGESVKSGVSGSVSKLLEKYRAFSNGLVRTAGEDILVNALTEYLQDAETL